MTDFNFILIAGALVLAALAFVLWPLLAGGDDRRRAVRHALRELESRRHRLDDEAYATRRAELAEALADAESGPRAVSPALIIGLLLMVPAATLLMYRTVGTPEALHPPEQAVAGLNQAIADLARRLERNPDDTEGWILMGMTYKQLEQFTSAEHALRRALLLAPGDAHIKVELAETLLFASGGRRMPEESRALLEHAVALEPDSQKALWLLGIAEFQHADYRRALDWWEQLDDVLEDGSVRDSVRRQMAEARGRLDRGSNTGDTNSQPPPAVLAVTVSLDPRLAVGLDGNETVFVYARAVDGPPMPLAIRRLRADDLPATVDLDDRQAMTPELRLSQFDAVIVTARVSHSGQATPEAGDLYGQSEAVATGHGHRVSVLIDRVAD